MLVCHLQHGARLLRIEGRERIDRIAFGVNVGQSHGNAPSARDRHLGKRHGQTAVAAVVICERELLFDDLLHRVEESLHRLRIRVGRLPAELVVHLRKAAASQTVLGMAKIDIDEA